jgi:Protein of unknown function (DUF2612)
MTDSGPPYPRFSPGFTPGTNSIGQFQIGISPLGELSPFDPWTTLLSQYSNSPIITGLITSFNAAMDLTQFYEQFLENEVDITTAVGYGLDVLGRIVGVTRVLKFSGLTPSFGFNEANSWTGFNQGSFASGSSSVSNFILQDSDFRRLILAKAAGNISDGSIRSTNSILLQLFPGRGTAYIADNQNMTATYTFSFPLTPVDLAILQTPGVLPDPAGVGINITAPPS